MGFLNNLLDKFASSDNLPHVSAEDLKKKIRDKDKFVLLDIRNDHELKGVHGSIKGVKHIPLDHLPDSLNVLSPYLDDDIILICQSGARARIAGRFLHKKGYPKVFILDGGMEAWIKLNPPKNK